MQQASSRDDGHHAAKRETGSLVGIVDDLKVVTQVTSGTPGRTTPHVAPYQHDAGGDEDDRQHYPEKANDPTKELTQAITEWPSGIPVHPKCGEETQGDEDDTPHIATVAMQDPNSIWGNDVSSPRRVRAVPCCSGPA